MVLRIKVRFDDLRRDFQSFFIKEQCFVLRLEIAAPVMYRPTLGAALANHKRPINDVIVNSSTFCILHGLRSCLATSEVCYRHGRHEQLITEWEN